MTSIIDTLTRRNPTLGGPTETAQNLVKNNTHDGGHVKGQARPVETGQFSAAGSFEAAEADGFESFDLPPSNLPSRGWSTECPVGSPGLPEAIRQPCPVCKCPTWWRDPYEHWHCANCIEPRTRSMVRERIDLVDVPIPVGQIASDARALEPDSCGKYRESGSGRREERSSIAPVTPAPTAATAATAATTAAAAAPAVEKIRWLEKYEPPSPAHPRGRNYHVRADLTPAEAWIAEHCDDEITPWAARLLAKLR